MSLPLTELAAMEFDILRELEGYDEPLVFEVYASGQDAGTEVLAVEKGWKLEETGSISVRVIFSDRPGVREVMFGDKATRPTRFRAAGILYVINDNGITQPKKEPRLWAVAGTEIKGARGV